MNNEKKERFSFPVGFTPAHTIAGLPIDSPILVAFSGGADSTALLHITARFGAANGVKVYAAHLNHGIRGAEADRDEEFCEAFCKKLGIIFFSKKVDVPSLAKKTKKSIETAARDARYEFFDSLMREQISKFIDCTADTQTSIINLFLQKKGGIDQVREFYSKWTWKYVLNK